jgi:hypothetical protein
MGGIFEAHRTLLPSFLMRGRDSLLTRLKRDCSRDRAREYIVVFETERAGVFITY